MSESKIVIPEGMLRAACEQRHGVRMSEWPESAIKPIKDTLETALLWLDQEIQKLRWAPVESASANVRSCGFDTAIGAVRRLYQSKVIEGEKTQC